MNNSRPVFAQIMELIENDIISGVYHVDDTIISTTQIAKIHSVNPATAVKAVGRLAEDGILYKKAGIGMHVAGGAKEKIMERRKEIFLNVTIEKFLVEAKTLAFSIDELITIIKAGANHYEYLSLDK